MKHGIAGAVIGVCSLVIWGVVGDAMGLSFLQKFLGAAATTTLVVVAALLAGSRE